MDDDVDKGGNIFMMRGPVAWRGSCVHGVVGRSSTPIMSEQANDDRRREQSVLWAGDEVTRASPTTPGQRREF
jgi:hypothetical protein